jgi:subtilase family serine protease
VLAFALLASACSSGGTGTTVPLTPAAGGTNQGVVSDGLGAFVAPNVREVCQRSVDRQVARCHALVRTDVVTRNVGPNVSGYGPADLQSAYNLPSSTNGAGQTIAIVDAYGYPSAESDLGVYRSNFGLPACTTANGCFKKVNQAGNPGPYPRSNRGWDFEQALDVDMVSAVCPKCHILLVQATSATFANLDAAEDTAANLGANAISNSWGGSGTTGGSHFNHPGHIILASSGDNGFAAGVQIPAGFPTVVSVGGTSLVRSGGGRGWTETVWNGTGSGCTSFAKPSWQTDSGCGNRTENDVAAVADPNTGVAVYKAGWQVFGGTSVSSPLLGGVYGLAGNAGSLNAAQSLYTNTGSLFDVVAGANGACNPAYLCTGGVGYDGPTGNGTPNGIGAF